MQWNGDEKIIIRVKLVCRSKRRSKHLFINKNKKSMINSWLTFLGESIDYYVNLSKLSDGFKHNLLKAIQDLVVWPNH